MEDTVASRLTIVMYHYVRKDGSAVPGGILRHWPTPIMPSRLRAFERP